MPLRRQAPVTLLNSESGVQGRGRGKTTKCSTQNAPSSCHTDKEPLQPKAQGIWSIHKYKKTTNNNNYHYWPQLLPGVNSVKFHLTSLKKKKKEETIILYNNICAIIILFESFVIKYCIYIFANNGASLEFIDDLMNFLLTAEVSW